MANTKLLFVEGPGGPDPSWYLPRLRQNYVLRILWSPTGDPEQDTVRHLEFRKFGDSIPISSGQDRRIFLAEEARKWKPEGILAFSERVATDAHAVASQLGLPGTSAEAADNLKSKFTQRLSMASAGILVPKFQAVANLNELRDAAEYVGFPAVLKPTVGVGSLATYPVDESTNLDLLWRMATGEYIKDSRGNGTASFVLEERLIGKNRDGDPRYGDQASVESIVQGSKIRHLTISDKLPLARHFRETGDVTPSSLPHSEKCQLESIAESAIKALGLDHCAVHTEFKLTARGPRVIEVNGRIGGGVTQLLQYSADFDVVSAIAAVAVGQSTFELPQHYCSSAQFLIQPPYTAARIVRVPEPHELRSFPEVQSAEVFCSPGDSVDWRRGTSARIARIFATARDPQQLLRINEELYSRYFPASMFLHHNNVSNNKAANDY